jgi:hypothetical protein
MDRITLQDIIADRQLSYEALVKELASLKKTTTVSAVGNRILYHFQTRNLLQTRRIKKKYTLPEILDNTEEYEKLLRWTMGAKRTDGRALARKMYEIYTLSHPIVFFKPSVAKWLYSKFHATHVLDPTAGWGGRMLGAHVLGIHYTGIDTNTSLQPAYQGMMELMGDAKMRMLWEDTLKVDYESIDYDFVLTSTPYVDNKGEMLEVYEHQVLLEDFYGAFLVPLIQKCLRHIKRQGRVCFNMNAIMYEEVAKRFRPANEEHMMVQSKRTAKNNAEKIYVWY